MDSIVDFKKKFLHLKFGLREHEHSKVKKFEQKFLRLKKEYKPVQELTLARKLESTRRDAPDFNIFQILGVQHLEDNTHSPFLANLLNPAGSHGQGHLFLKTFLELFHEPRNQQFPLPDLDLSSGRWTISRESRSDDGFLDIVMRNQQLGCLYVVENKINAPEQPRQIARYQKWLRSQYRYPYRAVIFLTPTGRQPSTGSAFCLSYHGDITTWLEQALDQIEAIKVRETIRQYLAIISSGKEEAMSYEDTVLKFLGQPENIPVALEIAAYVGKLQPKLHWHFWRLLNERLNDLYQDSVYRSTWTLSKMSETDVGKSYRGCHLIPFAAEKRPEIPILWFGFRQHDLKKKRNFYYGIRWKDRSEAAKDYTSPELTHLLQELQTQKVKSGLPYWPAFTWLDFSPFSEGFIINMTNEPETFVSKLVDDFWRQFVANVEAVEAVNHAVAGDIGSI